MSPNAYGQICLTGSSGMRNGWTKGIYLQAKQWCVCVCAYVCPCIFRRNFTCKFRTSTHMSVIAITNEDRTSASTSPVHGSAAVVWQPKVRLHSTPGNCKRVVKLELGEYIVWNSWLSRESKTYGCWRRPELKYVNSWLEEIGRKWTKRKNCI